jgi:hypothetical protein
VILNGEWAMRGKSRNAVKFQIVICLCGLAFTVSTANAQAQWKPKGAKASSTGGVVKITQSNNIWWFNGYSPYSTSAVLTAQGTSAADVCVWQVVTGADKASVVANITEGGVGTSRATITSKGASVPAAKVTKDIEIKVVINGSRVVFFKTVVFAPYRLVHTGDRDVPASSIPGLSVGFYSYVSYDIYDQFNRLLPRGVPLNEDFTSDDVGDYFPIDDWELNESMQGSLTTTVPRFNDNIGQAKEGSSPAPLVPSQPLASVKVDHWTGNWNIGSETTGGGISMRSSAWSGTTYCIWQRYRGKGRHR